MLASVLHTKVAEQTSVNIMRTFVKMRKYISTNLIEQKYINELVLKVSKRIDLLEKTFSINRIGDNITIKLFIEKLNNIIY